PYSYVVHNSSATFTWTGAITDDNGTPLNTGDDITVATGVIVGPGADSTTYTHTSGALATGTVTNIATASGAFNDPASSTASDTDTQSVTVAPCSITLTKTVDHRSEERRVGKE